MQPLSFDEFLKQQQAKCVDDQSNGLKLSACPTPGCGSTELIPFYEDGILDRFSCDSGCHFTVKRNAFTGEIVYFHLDSFDESRFPDPGSIRGMKFNPVGECYADWY
jgi:hypothetical protein